VISFEPPEGPNNEGGQASKPANGPEPENHLHYNPFPRTAAPGQENVCEAGNIKYKKNKTVIGNVPSSELHGTDTREFASSKESGE
jgi:hypothetical protein